MLTVIFSAILEAVNNILPVLGYVTNSCSYPQPLQPEDELEYFLRYKKGDMEARNMLITSNLRLIAHIVEAKYSTYRNDYNDLISAGTFGLIKAIDSFDLTRNTKLSTYAARCIENEILMELRKKSKTKNEISLEQPVDVDSKGNETTLMDMIDSDCEPVAERAEKNIFMRWLLANIDLILDKLESKVVKLRYGMIDAMGKTQQEVADMLGISRSYVSRIEKKAIVKLKKAYDKC